VNKFIKGLKKAAGKALGKNKHGCLAAVFHNGALQRYPSGPGGVSICWGGGKTITIARQCREGGKI
jgi:hypothetical protein